MSIILLILKIIGIILLTILGIIVLALLTVLFIPIHYEVSGEILEETIVHGRIHWLLHMISFSVQYEKKQVSTCFRIFGIQLKKKNRPREEKEPEMSGEPEEFEEFENDEENEAIEESQRDEHKNEVQSVHSSTEPIKTVKHSKTFSKIKDTILVIKKELTDETNKRAVGLIWNELRYLIRHFRFRKIDTDLTFSAGDPAMTGQVLGVLCMIPFLYGFQFHIYPDFEAEDFYIQGTFHVAGRIRFIHGVRSLIRLLMQKDVRTIIRKVIR